MFPLIIFCLRIILVHGLNVFPLNEYEWHVENVDKLIPDKISTKIPTGIYSDLFHADILETDPIYRFNDKEYRWVAQTAWMYYVEFPAEENVLNAPNVELIFHGLDGTATILFNEKEIGKTANSFIRYRFDITPLIKQNNNLKIIFDPPLKNALEMSKKYQNYISPKSSTSPNEGNVHFLRRMQASFGTDWSPTLPSVGIWKEIELLVFRNDMIIRDITTHLVHDVDREYRPILYRLGIEVYCDIPLNSSNNIKGNIKVVLSTDDNDLISYSKSINIDAKSKLDKTIQIHMLLRFKEIREMIKLWWPNGYGEQNLYNLTVTYFNSDGIIISRKSIKVGFRTAELRQPTFITMNNIHPNAEFYFSINKTKINIKGANFLPVDILPEKSSNKNVIKSLLLAAKMAHMNMLRVPAVGIYQSDYFYELCDEYGILVWQDMMFYKEVYPISAGEDQTDVLKTEIIQQITRLQYHPSIVLWVSNSDTPLTISKENDRTKNDWKTQKFLEYYKIFFYISEVYDKRPNLASTPSNGTNEYKNYIKFIDPNNAHITLTGNSWLPRTPIRFATELGIRSFPSLNLLKRAATADDLSSVNTDFIHHRQHRDEGDSVIEILCSIAYHFGIPRAEDLENLIYASQINQAWSLKIQTDWFRRWKVNWIEEYHHTGLSNGVLIWHLNDVWAAPTFSSIEFGGKWKMVQYYAHKFFNPVSSYVDISSIGEINVYILSDIIQYSQINVKVEIFKWITLMPIYSYIKNLRHMESNYINKFSINNFNSANTLKKECDSSSEIGKKCLIKVTFMNTENEKIHHNYILPAKISFKDINLPNPNIKVTVKDCNAKRCTIEVETDAIALFVWLDVGEISGYFSDNGFIMTEKQKYIEFYPDKEISADELKEFLDIKVMDKDRLDKFDYPPKNFHATTCKNYT